MGCYVLAQLKFRDLAAYRRYQSFYLIILIAFTIVLAGDHSSKRIGDDYEIESRLILCAREQVLKSSPRRRIVAVEAIAAHEGAVCNFICKLLCGGAHFG